MLKSLALALLFLACGGTGALVSRGMLLRVRELERSLQMLASLRAQLQFSRPPLERMMEEVCAGECPAFLPGCLTRMRFGIAFPEAWRGALEAVAYHPGDKVSPSGIPHKDGKWLWTP